LSSTAGQQRDWHCRNYCGLKDGEMIANVTSIDNNINVRFVPSPYANEPVPGVDHYDMDLKAAKPDELPPPAIPIAYQSKPIPQEPRTELDIEPEKPWYKRPITGKLARGPLQWGGKNSK
jgi:hypothetical protein